MITDVEQARVGKGQLFLFPYNARDVCRDLGLNWRAVVQLHKNDFLSFNPVTAGNLDSAQVTELKFLGLLIIAGCTMRMLKKLTRYLHKPYQYRIDLIYYDWLAEQWLLLPEIEEYDEEEVDEEDPFESWLEGL
jgi:hypothetical protein